MKLRFFKRMFVDKIIFSGVKDERMTIILNANQFCIQNVLLSSIFILRTLLIAHFHNLPCILRSKLSVFT